MSDINWINLNAKKVYLETVDIYGTPTTLCSNKGGIAIWNKKDLANKELFGLENCFNEIIIRDESIKHLCPKEHYDFIYTSIIVPVEPHQVSILSSLSGSVSYDPLKNTVSARCGSIEANIATLKLCTDLLLGNDEITKVHNNGTYGKLITSTSDAGIAKKIYSQLCDNIKKLNKNKLNDGFWKGAFSIKNNACLPPDKANKAQSAGALKEYKYMKYKNKYLSLKYL